MDGPRQARQRQKWRETLERSLDQPLVSVEPFFHDHAELVRGLAQVLDGDGSGQGAGLPEACLALARHMEEDRDLWLRRLARVAAEPALRARQAELDRDYQEVFAQHFRRWQAAGVQGERLAELEASLVLAAIRGAERLWLAGQGRPVLPVLVQEALALLWPALYGHARRHPGR